MDAMKKSDIQRFEAILKKNNNHLTKARLVTFSLLFSPQPQTIQQIQAKAKGKIDRVSVYRNIELFEKLGIVQRSYVGWKYKLELSDKFLEHHHHLNCLNCGRIIDVTDEEAIEKFIDYLADEFDFKPIRHHFEVDGYCSNCRNSA